MSDHENVRISFSILDRNYEAVGFLRDREPEVNGEEMFRRAASSNGGAIGEEDCAFLARNKGLLPGELSSYNLLTCASPKAEAKLDHDGERRRVMHVVSFIRVNGEWCEKPVCACKACDRGSNELVIRRCS